MRSHQGTKCELFGISKVIYHKFSHGSASSMLNGENVNVMLESSISYTLCSKINKMDQSSGKEEFYQYELWDNFLFF